MLKTLWKYLFNRKSIKDPKKINRKTIKYFIQGHLRELLKDYGQVDSHILEESSWRRGEVEKKSPMCLKTGKCIYCECSINETLISDPACEHGCFPEMRTKETWEEFKEQNKIEF